MKQLTPTHHRNYLKVEHKSTGRCTPFAPRHLAALFPNPYDYQHNKVIRNKTYKISSALFMCIRTYAGPVPAWTIQWWIQRTTITGNK